MSSITSKTCIQARDQEDVVNLLYALKDELYLSDKAVCQQIAELCFAQGGVIGVFDGSCLVAMLGYFYGSPECNYVNKEVAFMYVAGIREPYRLTRIFYKGLIFSLQQFQKAGAKAIKLQAEAANPYTNRLYGRFARPTAKSKSLRGKEVITYGSSIKEALGCLQHGQRRSVLPPSADEVLTAVGYDHSTA